MGYGAPDRPQPEGGAVPWASWRIITPAYLETLGVPLLAGRNFTEQDSITRPWRVIISRRLAESLWPRDSAVGRVLTLWQGQSNVAAEVIGVAADMRDWSLAGPPSLAVYLCCGAGMSPLQLVVHTRGRPQAIVPVLRDALLQLDSNLPLHNVRTFDELVGGSVASRRFTMLLLGALAFVALVLAMAGVYGVLSRRKAEIGMRIALGASRANVLRLIVAQGMRPVLAGLLLGAVAALAVARVLSSLLFEVTPADSLTYTSVGMALAGAAALSCYLPARHATRLDVVAALREE
jgi:putative ABC transport system permease protein